MAPRLPRLVFRCRNPPHRGTRPRPPGPFSEILKIRERTQALKRQNQELERKIADVSAMEKKVIEYVTALDMRQQARIKEQQQVGDIRLALTTSVQRMTSNISRLMIQERNLLDGIDTLRSEFYGLLKKQRDLQKKNSQLLEQQAALQAKLRELERRKDGQKKGK